MGLVSSCSWKACALSRSNLMRPFDRFCVLVINNSVLPIRTTSQKSGQTKKQKILVVLFFFGGGGGGEIRTIQLLQTSHEYMRQRQIFRFRQVENLVDSGSDLRRVNFHAKKVDLYIDQRRTWGNGARKGEDEVLGGKEGAGERER